MIENLGLTLLKSNWKLLLGLMILLIISNAISKILEDNQKEKEREDLAKKIADEMERKQLAQKDENDK